MSGIDDARLGRYPVSSLEAALFKYGAMDPAGANHACFGLREGRACVRRPLGCPRLVAAEAAGGFRSASQPMRVQGGDAAYVPASGGGSGSEGPFPFLRRR